ncbi:MAG: hypothetical protein LBD02_01465 [Christensenellaceae bacterium]|jgi:hypothetical protein|nr:hypothetical protein [Christensenellaceae bacterium]
MRVRFRPGYGEPMSDCPKHISGHSADGTLRFASLVIIVMAWFLLAFTLAMVALFIVFREVPDTLVTAVFGVAGGEALALALKRIFEKKTQEEG